MKRRAPVTWGLNGTTAPLTYPVITKGRAEAENAGADVNYFLGVNVDGNVAADFEEAAAGSNATGLNHPIVGNATIPIGEWHHIAATYDGTTWTLYVDGQPDAQRSSASRRTPPTTRRSASGSPTESATAVLERSPVSLTRPESGTSHARLRTSWRRTTRRSRRPPPGWSPAGG